MALRLAVGAVQPGVRGQIDPDFGDPLFELVRLLHEASEIEHALMVQYLFAAFSVKESFRDVLVGPPQESSSDLLGVAIQEMQHLHEVNLMLMKIGAAPNLIRQDFPYEAEIYPFAFNLEPLSRTSVAKYVWTEAPPNEEFLEQLKPVLGDARVNHLGSLYADIIGLTQGVIEDPPSPDLDLSEWPDRLNAIKGQGEKEHFEFFKSLFLGTHPALAGISDVWDLPQAHPNYPALCLPVNPTAIGRKPVSDSDAIANGIAVLTNMHYWIVLILLDIRYRHDAGKAMLHARNHMAALLELGYHLAQLGRGVPFDPLSLGYGIGRNTAGTQLLLTRLLTETMSIFDALRSDLPQDYSDPSGATLAAVPSILSDAG
jgi:hypothetical protein